MPLTTSTFDTLAADIKAAPAGPVFVLFSSTEVNGKKWCRGCIDIEPDIERVFANGPHNALAIYLDFSDFEKGQWPQEEWALRGVPTVYRVEDGKPTVWLMEGAVEFGGALDALVSPSDAVYESYLEEHSPLYVDKATRWAWTREDWDREEAAGKANAERTRKRKAIVAEQAAARKAAAGGGEGAAEEVAGEAKETEAVACTPATCA